MLTVRSGEKGWEKVNKKTTLKVVGAGYRYDYLHGAYTTVLKL